MSAGQRLQLDRETFLGRYWQREPLLIENALPGFEPPITANELAGLALEEEIESRIIELSDGQWRLQHGPFEEIDFDRKVPWTLLVQAVDHYMPAVTELRRLIDFLPQWRVDDVMVSYATDGGSVGPHYDNYDVFLLQGEGQRLWRLGQHCNADSALLPHDDLKILQDFEQRQEYLLNPGDILYVPPGVAHWGLGVGECTTFSIGFRAPRLQELLSHWVDQVLAEMPADSFYRDGEDAGASGPGQISDRDLEMAQTQLLQTLQANTNTAWFGELVTEPRYDLNPVDINDEEWHGSRVSIGPDSRFAWYRAEDAILVFANGQSHRCSVDLQSYLEPLASGESLPGATQECRALFNFLAGMGALDVE